MTGEEREKVTRLLIDRLIKDSDVAWSDHRIDLYRRFYLHNYSNEKLIAELLGVDNDK